MVIKAERLKESKIPEKTKLYEVRKSRNIPVEEKQDDGSLDQVILEYSVEDDNIGYFAKEYRPDDVEKTGAKVIDITAVMLNHAEERIRWHLYDIKDTLAGEHTVVQLYDQWNSGLQYLQHNILDNISGYSLDPDLGVITRCYDSERMERLKVDYQRRCDEIENYQQSMNLAQRKKRTDIAKYRAILKAAKSILEGNFQAENGRDTYKIQIRQLISESGQIYKMRFPV